MSYHEYSSRTISWWHHRLPLFSYSLHLLFLLVSRNLYILPNLFPELVTSLSALPLNLNEGSTYQVRNCQLRTILFSLTITPISCLYISALCMLDNTPFPVIVPHGHCTLFSCLSVHTLIRTPYHSLWSNNLNSYSFQSRGRCHCRCSRLLHIRNVRPFNYLSKRISLLCVGVELNFGSD